MRRTKAGLPADSTGRWFPGRGQRTLKYPGNFPLKSFREFSSRLKRWLCAARHLCWRLQSRKARTSPSGKWLRARIWLTRCR